jgi:hypothetical protein
VPLTAVRVIVYVCATVEADVLTDKVELPEAPDVNVMLVTFSG